MRRRIDFAVLVAALLVVFAFVDAFSASSNANLAVYYGQNSAGIVGAQGNLASYCTDSTLDIIPLAFLYIFFDSDGLPAVNFAAACEGTYFTGTTLLQCTQMGQDIKTCQANGKKILLSLGGAAGSYGFTSDAQASSFADELWNLFGGGNSSTRPFGDAVIDGFDLDIEGGSTTGYATFVTRMRQNFANDTTKTYYISGAPQCPLPDAYLNTALTTSYFDFIFVQFYNNYCGINTYVAGEATNFNFEDWDTFAKTQSYNPNAKVFLGVPASASAAGTGYVDIETLGSAAQYLQSTYSSFGGIMMWDCSQAWLNLVSSGVNYAQQAKIYLASGAQIVISSTGSSSASVTTVTTTAIGSSTVATVTVTTYPTSASTSSLLGLSAVSCPAGCVPISGYTKSSYSSTITVLPTTVSTSTGPTASGCPVNGESCAVNGAMACAGYSYGQCANGVWVVRQCASGLACFEEFGSVYCDWASNGQIVDCGSSTGGTKVKRQEYGVQFVDGSTGDTTSSVTTSSATGLLSWLFGSSTTSASSTASPSVTLSSSTAGTVSSTADPVTAFTEDLILDITTTTLPDSTTTNVLSVTPIPYYYNMTTSSLSSSSSSVSSSSDGPSSLVSPSASASPSIISSVTPIDGTPITNVSLAIQPLNTTNFLAVLQAATLNNTPILTDWSFSFNSAYQIIGTDRGNLSKEAGTDIYTITSIPIQEPSTNMRVVVKLWGVYDDTTAEGMVGVDGVGVSGNGNGTFAFLKRSFQGRSINL